MFDPTSPQEIARAMSDLLRDTELRVRMERLGQQRSSLFSWHETGRPTLEVYYDVVESRLRHQPAATRRSASISTR